jgi:hypothetical protein
MVGRFTNEGKVKAGAIEGPELTSYESQRHRRMQVDSRRIGPRLHRNTRYRRHERVRNLGHILRSDFQKVRRARSPQYGRNREPDGHSERRPMDLAWRGQYSWKSFPHPVHDELCFKGLLRIHRRVGRGRETHGTGNPRNVHPCRGHQARDDETGAVTAFHP